MTESVTEPRKPESKGGMGVFGWVMFLGMIIILIPFTPFIVLIKVIDLLFGPDGES